MKIIRFGMKLAVGAAMLSSTLFSTAGVALGSPVIQEVGTSSQGDNDIQNNLSKKLNNTKFKGIQVSVKGGIATLSGTTNSFADKEDADKKAHGTRNVVAVENKIVISGARVSDQELTQKLLTKLEYDRVGYGTTAFNAISVSVVDGIVTLGGHAYGPSDKDSAISVASYMSGVQDVVDEIEVDPASPMDDQIRMQVARAVYGYSALSRYGMDPAKPIRISVQRGNVTLFGLVDSQTDKDLAYLRANSVGGVFKVTNELQVEAEGPEHK